MEPETEVNERFAGRDLGSSDPVPRTRDLGIAVSTLWLRSLDF